MAQAWFQGLDPALDDSSATMLIRERDLEEIRPAILAAREFAATG